MGEDKYPFRAHETNLQDVVRVPHNRDESCTEVAQVAQRLHVQVLLAARWILKNAQRVVCGALVR